MKSITAKQLKSRTGEVLRRVGRGERVLVTRRGKPCALLSPVAKDQAVVESFRPYADAWAEIQQALRRTKPRHKTWKDAIRWSRLRD